MMPKFILFSNYFRIKPVLHLRKLADRIANNSLDDSQYDKAFIRWSREHDLDDLKPSEIAQAEKLIEKVNEALQ